MLCQSVRNLMPAVRPDLCHALALTALLLPLTTWGGAGHSHEHGVATLNLALSPYQVHLEFLSPAYNLLGFEHAPQTQAQQTAVNQMLTALADGHLFNLQGGGCILESHALETGFTKADMPRHGNEPGHEHKHGHAHHDHQHLHDEPTNAAGFHDLLLLLGYNCDAVPERLSIAPLLAQFPAIAQLQVQVVGMQGQRAQQLTPAQPVIRLR